MGKWVTLTSLHQTHFWNSLLDWVLAPSCLYQALWSTALLPVRRLQQDLWSCSFPALSSSCSTRSSPIPFSSWPWSGYWSPHISPLSHPPTLTTCPLLGLPWGAHKHAVFLNSWSQMNSADLMWSTVVPWRPVSDNDLQASIPCLYWDGTNSRTVRRNGWGKGVKLCLSLCKRGNDLRILKSLLLPPLFPFSSSSQKLVLLQMGNGRVGRMFLPR